MDDQDGLWIKASDFFDFIHQSGIKQDENILNTLPPSLINTSLRFSNLSVSDLDVKAALCIMSSYKDLKRHTENMSIQIIQEELDYRFCQDCGYLQLVCGTKAGKCSQTEKMPMVEVIKCIKEKRDKRGLKKTV